MSRKNKHGTEELRLPALEISQGQGRTLYSFAVDGKVLPRFAAISRIRRGEEANIHGYQRPEVLSHISEIRAYLESEAPMIPNSIVLAFDSRVRFEPLPGAASGAEFARLGSLVVPVVEGASDADKVGWVVDGQQRMAAIRDARIKGFPISVVSFIADSEREQREQFILVNSTKPLPKGLIYELLPTTDAQLPKLLNRRRFPAFLMNRLNHDEVSPLKGMVKTPTNAEGVIRDNSVLKMLENSLTDGALYKFRDADTGEGDADSMVELVSSFWSAASEVFKDAWGQPPRRSRLMHGAGVVSMGFLMDAISDRLRDGGIPSVEQFKSDLEPLRDVCRWTDGYWDFGPGVQRKWNEIQNTSKDIQMLSNYLLMQYRTRVWNSALSSAI